MQEDRKCWVLADAPNPMRYCEQCIRSMHGYDSAEESYVRAIVGAAVAAALDTGASVELVRLAVNDAVDERIRFVAAEYGPRRRLAA